MSLLNLRGEDSPSELSPSEQPNDKITLPETPPGLDEIRAWLRRPRPWLHGIKLWIDWILSAGPATWRLLKKHGPRAAKWLGKGLRWIVAREAPLGKALTAIAEIVRDFGVRFAAGADAFRGSGSGQSKSQRKLRETGEAAQHLGELIKAFAKLSGAVLALLRRLARVFRSDPPPSINPRQESSQIQEKPPEPLPAPQSTPETPEPERENDPADSATPEPEPEALPAPQSPPEKPRAPSPEDDPPPEPAPENDPPGVPSEKPPDEPEPEPAPDRHQPPPAPSTTPAVKEPDVKEPDVKEPDVKEPEAKKPEPKKEDRFKGLPPDLLPHARNLPDRPSHEVLHTLILEICILREWSTAKELARWLDMHQPSLVARHLRPLVKAGLLELRVPDRPSSRAQAYRTCPDRWPPHR